MIKLRENKIVKLLCLLMSCMLLYTSCSSDGPLSPNNGCTQVYLDHFSNEDVAWQFEQMLDLAKSLDNQEGYETLGEYHKELYGETEEATKYVNAFERESDNYVSLGFNKYVNQIETVSNELKSYFISYSKTLTSFLNSQNPNLEQFTQFMNNQMGQIHSSELCDNDQQLMQHYLSASQGYGNWYYKHYFDGSDGTADLRGCNFWEALGCGLLALIVGVIVGVVVGVIVFLATITVTDPDGNTSTAPPGQDGLAALAGFALGIYVGVNIYKWCCGKDEIEGQECIAPTGSIINQLDCDEFRFRVWGPSNYSNTDWNNENTDPATLMTNKPFMSFTVPSFGDPSTFKADIACVENASAVTIFQWDETLTVESDLDLFPLQWNPNPPNTVQYWGGSDVDNIYDFKVNTPGNDTHTYQWSVTPPHQIWDGGGIHDNKVTIEVWEPDSEMTITVTATNVCLGGSETISHFVIID